MTQLVIAGGGFAGVWAAMGAAAVRASAGEQSSMGITLVSRDPYLTIRPRLYEQPAEAHRVPLSSVLDGIGVGLRVAEIEGIDSEARTLSTPEEIVSWDALVFACGSRLRRPAWHEGNTFIHSVDTFQEAQRLDQHLRAISSSPVGRSVVVVGSGLAGLEVATAVGARVRELCGTSPSVTLVEAGSRVAPSFSGPALRAIEDGLLTSGVTVVTASPVVAVDARGAILEGGRRLQAGTVIWTGGLEASPLTHDVSTARDDLGRVLVTSELAPVAPLSSGGGVFVAGDSARAVVEEDHETAMSCQHAMPLGRLAGHNAAAHLLGLPAQSLALPEYVTCVDLGPAGAVLTRGWDRDLALEGAAGKDVKRAITERLIYPPVGDPAGGLAVGRGENPVPAGLTS